MQPNIPTKPEEYFKWVKIFNKYPVTSFAVALFFMFVGTYYINYRLISASQEKSDKNAAEWKELYLAEKKEKDELKDRFIHATGIISNYEQNAIKTDSTVQQRIKEAQPYIKIIQKNQRK